jgi:hypothetical protein
VQAHVDLHTVVAGELADGNAADAGQRGEGVLEGAHGSGRRERSGRDRERRRLGAAAKVVQLAKDNA